MRLQRLLPFLLTAIFGLSFSTAVAGPLLSNIDFNKVSADKEAVVFKLNGFYPPTVFGIEGERPRVVCDFSDVRLKKSVKSLIETNGDFVRLIRVGIHDLPDNKVRAVMDLNPAYNYFIEQIFYKKDNIYTIEIQSLNTSQNKGVKVESLSDK